MAQQENEEIQKQQEVSSSSTTTATEFGVVDVKKDEENTLKFLDSVDDYLILTQSLSSTLRQGWLELASARYSMGGSRVNTGLLNLKPHSAATMAEIHYENGGSPQFSLLKWASSDDKESSLGKEKIEEVNQESSLESSNESESKTSPRESNGSDNKASVHKTENPLQKERAKVLSMFGTLVSPKLRASQLSFETALETLVEIANARTSILEAHDALHKDVKSITE